MSSVCIGASIGSRPIRSYSAITWAPISRTKAPISTLSSTAIAVVPTGRARAATLEIPNSNRNLTCLRRANRLTPADTRSSAVKKEFTMRLPVAISLLAFLSGSAVFAQDSQTVTVGAWSISTTYRAEKFDNCTMTRSAGGLGISFVKTQDGLLLIVDSPSWKLERGRAYSVLLLAGSQSAEAKAMAETKGVTVALADRPFNGSLRTANFMDIQGDGATLRVPLDGSSAAFDRLDVCFDKNSREGAETNPFVAPSRKP